MNVDEWARLCEVVRRGAFDPPRARLRREDDERTLALAREESVLGLAARGLGVLDDELRGQLLGHSMRLEHVYRRAASALVAAGIRFVAWKGFCADASFFGGRGFRAGGDVDLIISRRDADEGERALGRAGFARILRPRSARVENTAKARLFQAPGVEILVDLHVQPLNNPPFRADADEVLAQRRFATTAVGALPSPRPEHLLALIAGNLAGGMLTGQLRLCLDAAATCREADLEPGFLVDTARRWRVETPLWGLLRFVQERFGAPISREALAVLTPPRWLAVVVERVFGVRTAPFVPRSRVGTLLAVDWPLAGRPLWVIEKPLRAAARRLLERTAPSRQGYG